MKIAIGCDPNAADLENVVIDYVQKHGHEVKDLGQTTRFMPTWYSR